MASKTLSEQIIDLIREHSEKINKESFSVIELVCQKGRLDGMRLKEYIKARKETK